MSEYACNKCRPLIDPDVHRQIRLRRMHRLGLRGAIASVIADHAYGTPREAILMAAVPAGPLTEGGEQ